MSAAVPLTAEEESELRKLPVCGCDDDNPDCVLLGCETPVVDHVGADWMAAHHAKIIALIDTLRETATTAVAETEAVGTDAMHFEAELFAARKRIADLTMLLNTPEIRDFVKAVSLEAAHQRERWGADHDSGKTDADWFWLIGYLAGKALHNPNGDTEKKLHRIITVAAAACNWHAAVSGADTRMRPGIQSSDLGTE